MRALRSETRSSLSCSRTRSGSESKMRYGVASTTRPAAARKAVGTATTTTSTSRRRAADTRPATKSPTAEWDGIRTPAAPLTLPEWPRAGDSFDDLAVADSAADSRHADGDFLRRDVSRRAVRLPPAGVEDPAGGGSTPPRT